MDETTPLLPDEAIAPVLSNDQADRVPSKDLVEFDPNGDHENPMDWPKAYKWGIVALLAFMAFTVYVNSNPPPLCHWQKRLAGTNAQLSGPSHVSR